MRGAGRHGGRVRAADGGRRCGACAPGPPTQGRRKWTPHTGRGALFQDGGGAGRAPGPAPAAPALLRRAAAAPQPAARSLPEDSAQQRPGNRHHRGVADSEAAPGVEDPGGEERRGAELQFPPAGAAGHHRHRGLQCGQPLPLQRLGRGSLPNAANSRHRLPGPALQGTHGPWSLVPGAVPGCAVAAAVAARSPGAADLVASLPRARHRHQPASAGGNQLPQRAHGAAVGRHRPAAPGRLAGPDLHLRAGDGRPPDGSDLRGLLRLQRPHRRPAAVLLGRARPRHRWEEAGIGGSPLIWGGPVGRGRAAGPPGGAAPRRPLEGNPSAPPSRIFARFPQLGSPGAGGLVTRCVLPPR